MTFLQKSCKKHENVERDSNIRYIRKHYQTSHALVNSVFRRVCLVNTRTSYFDSAWNKCLIAFGQARTKYRIFRMWMPATSAGQSGHALFVYIYKAGFTMFDFVLLWLKSQRLGFFGRNNGAIIEKDGGRCIMICVPMKYCSGMSVWITIMDFFGFREFPFLLFFMYSDYLIEIISPEN